MPLEDWAELYYKGVTVDDLVAWGLECGLISKSDYDTSDLMFYKPPLPEVLQEKGVQMHWFSYYHNWLPQENYYYCAEHTGFQANRDGRSEGTYSKYASLDDRVDGFHYYLGYVKFGIGRTTSDAAHEIRDGKITREEGVALVKRYDGEFPRKYFEEFLQYCAITKEEFESVVDSWRSPHLWERVDGHWRLKHVVWESLVEATVP